MVSPSSSMARRRPSSWKAAGVISSNVSSENFPRSLLPSGLITHRPGGEITMSSPTTHIGRPSRDSTRGATFLYFAGAREVQKSGGSVKCASMSMIGMSARLVCMRSLSSDELRVELPAIAPRHLARNGLTIGTCGSYRKRAAAPSVPSQEFRSSSRGRVRKLWIRLRSRARRPRRGHSAGHGVGGRYLVLSDLRRQQARLRSAGLSLAAEGPTMSPTQ